MTSNLYTFRLSLDFKILGLLSETDRFDGAWAGIEKREGVQTLKQLKSIATVQSVGASTRIEGSKMTNDEVRTFINKEIKIETLVDRDQQEVMGYYFVLDTINEAYQDIEISESSLKNLHNLLMKFSEKDEWHKGKYKVNSNSVEATHTNGKKTIVFETTPPGIETEEAMRRLIDWYNSDKTTPPIIKSATFVYDFLSIHPFQDGNGRLSRLLATLLLLKQGYSWIQYVSFEHEIEHRKKEYYAVLMECQHQRPGEDITSWLIFFLECLSNIQNNLQKKLEVRKSENQLSPREKMIYTFVENHPGCKSGEIAQKLDIPLPTIKRILSEMVAGKFLAKYGSGTGTNYATEKVTTAKTDVAFTFNNEVRKKEFLLENKYAFVLIKKIILVPKFNWRKPDDWHMALNRQNLQLKITCYNIKGGFVLRNYVIESYVTPYHATPEFTLINPIDIPLNIMDSFANEFPIRAVIELESSNQVLEFDVILIYDMALE